MRRREVATEEESMSMSMTVCSGSRQTLASELAQLLAMAKELETHVEPDAAPGARELCRALASSVDKCIRIAGACCPESPAAGSPRSDGGGQDNPKDAPFKKRKGMAKVRRQVRVRSVQDVEPLDDGLSWRKYGQKDILGAKYPRAYFRCTHRHTQSCQATKQVQRADGDPLLFDVVYHGEHTCSQAAAAAAAQMPSPLLSAEQQQLRQFGHAGQEQSLALAVQTEGVHQGIEPVTPFSFPSTPAGIDGSGINGCFPFASPPGSECPLSSSYGLGVDMDMDFGFQLDDFLLNPSDFYHSEIQNIDARRNL